MQQQDREYYIRERAYQLWENDGHPEGQHERHWHTAAEEWETILAAHQKGEAHRQGASVDQGASGVATDVRPGGTTPRGDGQTSPVVQAGRARAKVRRSA